MPQLSDLRLSKDMKYTALYWAMRFYEIKLDLYEKSYPCGIVLQIQADKQQVLYDGAVIMLLDMHESFVVLELVDRVLSLGYKFSDFIVKKSQVEFQNFSIDCMAWNDLMDYPNMNGCINYKSRLVSGVLEYESKIHFKGKDYDYGVFEHYGTINLTQKKRNIFQSSDFVYSENRLMKYCGNSKVVYIPEGTEEIESSAFWDNQYIEEVVVPDTVVNLGGDTFYNCKNLKKINIPQNVRFMGNNPFAGCPKIRVKNSSPCFVYENGVLYNKEKDLIIYCSILGNETEFNIPEGVKIIGKHAFYMCDRFKHITLPKSLLKMENNPFSGCSKLELDCRSSAYVIRNDVIYNGYQTAVVGALNKIKSKRLVLQDGITAINRNAFWNCAGIETIVLPQSLENIGYNPFVGCSNIHFENHSEHFTVDNDMLYTRDKSKLICFPAWKAQGEVSLPDSVITLERGAFSGCDKMTEINLHNINGIGKSCFTNCTALKNIYCSDLITYIGEWAFAYCTSLKTVSVNRDTIIDNNAFSNTTAAVIRRAAAENYLVESDNIYTITAMQKAYGGKIDSILIDPPYNSNIGYIGYRDTEFESGYIEFMRMRLEKAYTLLSDCGFLIVNIDEGEVNELTKLCKKIFGDLYVTVHRWKKKNPLFDKNRVVLNSNKIQTDYEYIIVCRKSDNAILKRISQPYIDDDVLKEKLTSLPEDFDFFGTTSSAKDEIKEIFGSREYFSTPKPVKLIKELLRATTNKTSTVLDFFAGSGTLAHAVAELNAEDGGNRHFILVNNRESDICEKVTKKRLDYLDIVYQFLK